MRAILSNQEIARILYRIAEYLEMQEVPFKPRAYERAGRAVEACTEPVSEIYRTGGLKALEQIPGVGVSIAAKIEELTKTGRLKYYEELKKKTPVDVEKLSAIEGVGPKAILALYKKLGIRTVEDLEKAARQGKIRRLAHFGEKSEQKILKGIEFHKKRGGRFLLGQVLPLVLEIESRLKRLQGVEEAVVGGSIRRRKETIGDGDILAVSEKPEKVMDFFASMPEVMHLYGKGETKTMVRLKNGLDLDLRVVPREAFGAALQYFTGSKDHNIEVRKIAIKKGWKLSEYGIFKIAEQRGPSPAFAKASAGKRRTMQKETMIAGRTEEEVYEKLGLQWMPPEARENTGEIELALKHKFPSLIEYDDLRGDLQVQTDWTDGANSIEEMAREAKRLGREYVAITDHTKRLAMTGGLDEKKLLRQMAEIERLNKKLSGITILTGTECDILKDGSLDLNDEALAKLDVVGASVHSYFTMSREDMTKRIIRAISNPHVDILFHPTGRVLGKRDPYEVDIEAVIKAAKKYSVVLEANAYPDRLDLKDEHIRLAVDAGVKLAIDSDAHTATHLSFLHYGIAQARRGWAKKSDVVNAWPLGKMRTMLKKKVAR